MIEDLWVSIDGKEILRGINLSITKLSTFASGYVTASICLQPIQPGLKKSSKTGLFSFLDLAKAFSRLVSQAIFVDIKGIYRKKIKELTYWSL